MAFGECSCDETKALRVEVNRLNAELFERNRELTALREAAYPAIAWVARNGGGRDAVERLERVLAAHPEPAPKPSRCMHALGRHGITCELPTGHAGEHRCCQIGWT